MRKFVELVSGHRMPIIGLGTYQIRGYEVIHKVLDTALRSGFRSIDTASGYKNEEDIGKALKDLLPKHKLERKDIFIISKLGPKEHGKGHAFVACQGSLRRLDCDYLDLYLIHWPGVYKLRPNDPRQEWIRKESWQDMEDLKKSGILRSIGVANYLSRHIDELMSYCQVKPSVLQVEYHPHLVQTGLKQLCEKHNIHLQAYSSLGTCSPDNKLLTDQAVIDVAHQVVKSPAQVLLRWAVQQGIGVLPKSSSYAHIVENADIFSFSLTDEQMSLLSNQNKQHHYNWNPADIV